MGCTAETADVVGPATVSIALCTVPGIAVVSVTLKLFGPAPASIAFCPVAVPS